jgi:hypothetical protein
MKGACQGETSLKWRFRDRRLRTRCEQAHDPAELRAFAQDQKELYERGISLLLKAANNYDRCVKLLADQGKDAGALPLRIQLIRKQAEIMESPAATNSDSEKLMTSL